MVPSEEGGADTFIPFKSSIFKELYIAAKSQDGSSTYKYTATEDMTVIAFGHGSCSAVGYSQSQQPHYTYISINSSGEELYAVNKYRNDDGKPSTNSLVKCFKLCSGDIVTMIGNCHNNGYHSFFVYQIA